MRHAEGCQRDVGVRMSQQPDQHSSPLHSQSMHSVLNKAPLMEACTACNASESDPTPRIRAIPRALYRFPDLMGRPGAQPQLCQCLRQGRITATESKDVGEVGGESTEKLSKSTQHKIEKEAISMFMLEKKMEIIVVVEGTDPQTSHMVQATHSYKYEDIVWDHFFAPCTTMDENGE